jgi:hypothetical protein
MGNGLMESYRPLANIPSIMACSVADPDSYALLLDDCSLEQAYYQHRSNRQEAQYARESTKQNKNAHAPSENLVACMHVAGFRWNLLLNGLVS